jgi:hypothetical protein
LPKTVLLPLLILALILLAQTLQRKLQATRAHKNHAARLAVCVSCVEAGASVGSIWPFIWFEEAG